MAIQYGHGQIVTTGLVLNLDAADRNSYPGSGTTWTDTSGYSNNGTLTNGPTFDNNNGGAIVFDGTNDKVTSASNFTFGSTTQKSHNIWFKTSSATLQTLLFLGANLNDYKWQYIFITSTGGLSVMFGDNSFYNERANGITGFNLSTGNWTNLCVTVNTNNSAGNRVKIYINGTQYAISSFDNDSGNPFYDGGMYLQLGAANLGQGSDYYSPLNGQIAHVSLYNRALSASEVLQNYTVQRKRFGI